MIHIGRAKTRGPRSRSEDTLQTLLSRSQVTGSRCLVRLAPGTKASYFGLFYRALSLQACAEHSCTFWLLNLCGPLALTEQGCGQRGACFRLAPRPPLAGHSDLRPDIRAFVATALRSARDVCADMVSGRQADKWFRLHPLGQTPAP